SGWIPAVFVIAVKSPIGADRMRSGERRVFLRSAANAAARRSSSHRYPTDSQRIQSSAPRGAAGSGSPCVRASSSTISASGARLMKNRFLPTFRRAGLAARSAPPDLGSILLLLVVGDRDGESLNGPRLFPGTSCAAALAPRRSVPPSAPTFLWNLPR